MISGKTVCIALLLAFSISAACANEIRVHEFDATDINSVQIESRVGSVHIEASNDDVIHVELAIKEEGHRRWFFWGRPDLSTMDLKSRQHGSTLELAFDDKKVTTDWVIKIPQVDDLSIHVGVGAINISGIDSAIDTEIGVGEIEITTARASAGVIDLSVGVGEASIYGTEVTENQRSLVSNEMSALGEGSNTIRGEAGVGSIEVTLE